MKQLIFVLYLCVAMTVGSIDDITDRLADTLSISKIDVQICFNKTNVNLTDLMIMDRLVYDEVETPDINNSALKVSCLFACLLQKKELMVGTHIDIDKVKMELDMKMPPNDEMRNIRNRMLDTCIDQVSGMANECKVILKLILCTMTEAKRYEMEKRRNRQ